MVHYPYELEAQFSQFLSKHLSHKLLLEFGIYPSPHYSYITHVESFKNKLLLQDKQSDSELLHVKQPTHALHCDIY